MINGEKKLVFVVPASIVGVFKNILADSIAVIVIIKTGAIATVLTIICAVIVFVHFLIVPAVAGFVMIAGGGGV